MSRLNRIHNRPGITLLEILISIGVLSIGLLGVLALLPAASQQAKAGATQDAAAQMARRAHREMNVRWQDRDELFVSFGGATDNQIEMDRFYCIDPLGALLVETVPPPAAPTVPLVKLVSQTPLAGVPSANRATLGQMDPAGKLTTVYQQQLLESVFRTKDDLDFGEFASRKNPAPNPPQQVALKNNSTGLGIKRYATGGLSWFATVVAKNTGYNTVSVAIVNKRTSVPNDDGTTMDAVSEQLADYSMQGGTGELVVPMPVAPNLTGKEEVWSAVKPGHWILLAHVDAADGTASPTPGNDTAEWYRVQAIGAMDTNGDNLDDSRAITVAGNPWLAAAADTRAIVVPNVISVYSRSVSR